MSILEAISLINSFHMLVVAYANLFVDIFDALTTAAGFAFPLFLYMKNNPDQMKK